MDFAEFQLQGLGDPRIAAHAASAMPAWLWSGDGTRILWANAAGARVFGAADVAALSERIFGPADPQRRQIVQLASRLPANGAIRLERLPGFGAAPGMLATCGCSRFDFPDGSHGILMAAGNISLISPRVAPAALVRPVAAMQPEAESSAEPSAAAVPPPVVLPAAAADDEKPARSIEIPTEFAFFDALADETSEPAAEPVFTQHPSEPDLRHVLQLDLPHLEAIPLETPAAEAPPETATATPAHEPSPFIETVADETATDAGKPALTVALPEPDQRRPNSRRSPLRFLWQMDQEGRFTLNDVAFAGLIGPDTLAELGRPWNEIADTFGLDPDGLVMQAFATRATWNGIKLSWPVDGGGRLPVELSGLPIFDAARNFAGYRGFGVCRDLDALARLADMHRQAHHGETSSGGAPPPSIPPVATAQDPPPIETPAATKQQTDIPPPPPAELPHPIASETSNRTDLETAVEPPKEISKETSKEIVTDTLTALPPEAPKNVLQFRAPGDAKPPSLTPVENSAFNELARQLSARLDTEAGDATPDVTGIDETVLEKPAAADLHESPSEAPAPETPEWLAPAEQPARGETRRDKALLDLLPVGILIYRLDRLLYANPAFLTQMGYPSLHALEDAGGLDALYVEPGVSNASSTSDTGTPVTISASQPSDTDAHRAPSAADARLYTISWDGDSALALIFSGARHEGAAIAAALVPAAGAIAPVVDAPSPVGHANAEELGAILDTTTDGILMFDAEGNINSANRSAEALFGDDGDELARRNLADMFAPESRHAVFEYLAGVKSAGVTSLLDHGREVLGRESKGGIIPLSVTIGRTRPDGPNFFAVFRDLSHVKKTETELREARRLAERSATAKADVLARISHEVRTPLNAIIGFSEVMIGERFGTLGNERYVEYMKDIRASGERVIAIINDLLDLSRIETGKLDLAFTSQNLNELVESCVAVMQPQANRERIIIRTSLAHMLPPVVADARALRQIALNLIGNSIHLANAGGQVIVSTALSDFGEVMLRVRDTGHGLNDNQVAAALEPFRTTGPSDQTADSSGLSLSLTKALVEANRAKFQIKTGGHSGTLIEVVFSQVTARA